MNDQHDAELSPIVPRPPPPGYPVDEETFIELADGDRMFVRPVVPADAPRMERALAIGDPETIRRRFLTAAPPNHPNKIAYLVTLDYQQRFALVAMDDHGDSVGIARYEHLHDATAEVAVVVRPECRRRGVASHLLRRLEPHATRSGIREFVALFQPDNVPVARLLASLGYGNQRLEDGLFVVDKTLG